MFESPRYNPGPSGSLVPLVPDSDDLRLLCWPQDRPQREECAGTPIRGELMNRCAWLLRVIAQSEVPAQRGEPTSSIPVIALAALSLHDVPASRPHGKTTAYAALPSRFREAGARYEAAEFMPSVGRFKESERLTEAVLDAEPCPVAARARRCASRARTVTTWGY